MKIYDSLQKSKVEFNPITKGEVSMYVCGVTPYDYAHIGNARPAIVFDTLYRFLKAQGNKVTYVRNFTDVDDKIINRANEQGLENWQDLPKKFINIYHEDMAKLNVLGSAEERGEDETGSRILEPRVTDHIREIIDLIKVLLDKGHAYVAESGDVLYKTSSFEGYGQLSGNVLDALNLGQRVAVSADKEDATDFVLWKSLKDNEPMSWDFDYEDANGRKVNMGRPGWHIECSAMSKKHLGESFDIHGGGEDLKFPHHECEIAQSKGAYGGEFARYWMHNAFINVNGEKMSKSLGNFKTIHGLLENYSGEALRLWMLSTHYRKPVDLTDEALSAAEKKVKSWYGTLNRLLENGVGFGVAAPLSAPFVQAMADDLNTSLALSAVEVALKEINKQLDAGSEIDLELAAVALSQANVLGLLMQNPAEFLGLSSDVPAEVLEMLEKRKVAKSEKDWATADALKAQIIEAGYEVIDKAGGEVELRKK